MLKTFFSVVIVALLCSTARADSRVVIISIDGLRPDLALRADMPNVRRLMKNGSYTLWATTTPAAVTSPSHASMLTGVTIERHGIKGNDDKAAATEKLLVPSIFEIANKAGMSTGMAAGKSKFSVLSNRVDHLWLPKKSKNTDADVAHAAVEIITQHRPKLMVVHFAQNDVIGHGIGWGTREQVEALANTDRQLGRVLNALEQAGVANETTIILSADHGGAAKGHGGPDPRSQTIPWIITGPGVLKDVDMSQYKDLNIRTYDTFATACHVLGLTEPEGIDGRVVTAAFEATDLLLSAPTTLPTTITPPATQPVLPQAAQAEPGDTLPKLGEQPTTAPVAQ